jgi:hypothetical protein
MLICDWCHELIGEEEPEADLCLGFEGQPDLSGYLRFHEDCGFMALRVAQEAIEDHVGGVRPDPSDEEVLSHIPVLQGMIWGAPALDGPVSSRLELRRYLGSRQSFDSLQRANLHTLLQVSFRTRAEIASLGGVGPTTLARLDSALALNGLDYAKAAPRPANAV